MHSKLKTILEEKKAEVNRIKQNPPGGAVFESRPSTRDFQKAVLPPKGLGLIAEIKFASPSAGTIRAQEDPAAIARRYERAGASAISLLTDRLFFKGELNALPQVKQATGLPVLRKDFILDDVQLRESTQYGADAVLLIARILSKEQLRHLLQAAGELGLAALTEVHDRSELEQALESGAGLIGINNRNLDTFEVDLQTTLDLAPLVPAERGPVSESGIYTAEHMRLLAQNGVKAVLVGTAIMQAEDMELKIKELLEAGKG